MLEGDVLVNILFFFLVVDVFVREMCVGFFGYERVLESFYNFFMYFIFLLRNLDMFFRWFVRGCYVKVVR